MEEQLKELAELARPIEEWILKNYNLMCEVVIEPGFVRVIRNECRVATESEID